MKIIRTDLMDPKSLTGWEQDQVYNGLDICVTLDVFHELIQQLDDTTSATYDFSRALQGPVLDMRCRGILVDQARRLDTIDELSAKADIIEAQLERIIFEGVGLATFNWRSSADLRHLFYEVFGLPHERKKGALTTDRNARDKLSVYPIATQICAHINILADIEKKISVLRQDIDNDNRFRTSYNIAGTNTGRFSSSASEFDTGGNMQNVEEKLRAIFIADPGMKFAKFDTKSGESYCVGAIEWNLFRDGKYLDAVETGDIHTAVARLCWPNLGWTGNLSHDKKLAETPYYRHYTYRFMCKKLGHGSNYGGFPTTLAEQSHLPVPVVEAFQPVYFRAFPAHQQWQAWVGEQVRTVGYLTNLTGRKRYFFGRRSDPDTLRAAIAYDPQGSLADIVNRTMLRLWRAGYTIVQHEHDALTFMYPEEQEPEIIPKLLTELITPVALADGRELRIPWDAQVGWNKGKYDEQDNPNGLIDWKGHDKRKRTSEASVMDRILHRPNRRS